MIKMNEFIKTMCEVTMPKIIENIREQILEEAKKQVSKNGYRKTTIRSVAQSCGIGVGTVYNYFKSKDILIASFMMEDWNQCLEYIESNASDDAKAVLESIFNGLSDFMRKYRELFCDRDAAKVYATVFWERHKQLRHQLAKNIKPICINVCVKDKDFLAEWIAESLLTWTVSGKDFEEQYEMISQLLK